MNRARLTRRWTLLMTMAIIVYLTLKHEPVTKIGFNGDRNNNLRKAAGVSSEGWFHKFNDKLLTLGKLCNSFRSSVRISCLTMNYAMSSNSPLGLFLQCLWHNFMTAQMIVDTSTNTRDGVIAIILFPTYSISLYVTLLTTCCATCSLKANIHPKCIGQMHQENY